MHLLNAKRLSEELRQNTVPEVQKYHYILVSLVLQTSLSAGSVISARPTNGYFLELVVTSVITFIGLRACFKMNERGDNQHFLDRYICLSVPLLIWSYFLYVLLFYIGYATSHALWGKNISQLFLDSGPAVLVITSIMLSVYFVALRHFIGKAALL
jgi:hypothetical protein